MDYRLDRLFKNVDRIAIDTCTLMDYVALKQFLNENYELFYDYKKVIFVYKEVLQELYNHILGDDPVKSVSARNALDILQEWPNLFRLEKTPQELELFRREDCLADHRFALTALHDQIAYTCLYITNDGDLANDLLLIRDGKSVKGKRIYVKGITKEGALIDVLGPYGLYPNKKTSYTMLHWQEKKARKEPQETEEAAPILTNNVWEDATEKEALSDVFVPVTTEPERDMDVDEEKVIVIEEERAERGWLRGIGRIGLVAGGVAAVTAVAVLGRSINLEPAAALSSSTQRRSFVTVIENIGKGVERNTGKLGWAADKIALLRH